MQFDPEDKMPKYKQIVKSVKSDIERGILKKGTQLPSISELSVEYLLARDTVEKAYRELRNTGYITSVQGKGYYVQSSQEKKEKILLVFNKLSSYKKIIYYSFIRALGDNAIVDLEIHHYSVKRFREIIDKNLGNYNHYVIMPHFDQTEEEDYVSILKTIPSSQLVLLDREIPELNKPVSSIHQSFDKDIFGALESANDLMEKYQRLVLVFPFDGNYPKEIITGFRNYCINYNKEYDILEDIHNENLSRGTAYIVVEENDLAELVKKTRQSTYEMGREIGLISFNETTLKELLGITVVTTDFENMGRTAAALILNKEQTKVKNPFFMIRRGSL
ncbi:GntR family transcriptional regulator [Dyadobacter sp. CY356]|nr:GntR family transcriptional regulator [Dyadobacter sp. CY356]MCF0058860.1 GntR family transcriptional regulator [Dyadobacter sp. CY356]